MSKAKRVVIGDATLYHADCAVVLSNGIDVADITVTSPPYNLRKMNENGSGKFLGEKWIKKFNNGYDKGMPEKEYQKWLVSILDQCKKKTRGLMWVNHKIRFHKGAALHPARMFPYPIYSEIIWSRPGSFMLNAKRYIHSHEGFWAFGKPHYWNDMHNGLGSVWRITPRHGVDHPCPYPAQLIEPIIVSSSPHDGLVMDPFMGSGTTGVVAVLNGRKFQGIEKEKRYFDLACKNIEAAYTALNKKQRRQTWR